MPVVQRGFLVFIAVFLAQLGAGCGSNGSQQGGAAGNGAVSGVRPLERAVVAAEGQTLVVPVEIAGAMPPGGKVEVRLEPPGQAVEGTLAWFGPARLAAGTRARKDGESFADVWLGAGGGAGPGDWRVVRGGDGVPESPGFWAVVIRPPAGASGSGTLRMGAAGVPLRWISPEPVVRGAKREPPPTVVPADTVRALRASPWLMRALEVEARSPLTRWRARLAYRMVEGEGASVPPMPLTLSRPFAEPAIESLAQVVEARWQWGLGRLERADRVVAESVRWRLSTMVDFGGGVVMPAWPPDGPALAGLLEDLLEPGMPAGELVRRCRLWLDGRPGVVAWVVDEGRPAIAAPTGETDENRPSPGGLAGVVRVANLGWASMLCWASGETGVGRAEPPDLTPVPALTARDVVGRAPAREEADRIAGVAPTPRARGDAKLVKPAVLEVRAGDWRLERSIPGEPMPASPPGLRLGPLLPDWTMGEWLAAGSIQGGAGTGPAGVSDSEEPRAEPRWMTAALLFKDEQSESLLEEGLGRRAVNGVSEPGWVLYVECEMVTARSAERSAVPAKGAAAGGGAGGPGLVTPDEDVRVWLGPAGSTCTVLRVRGDGSVFDETNSSISASGRAIVGRVPVRVEADRWECWIPVPPECVERREGSDRGGLVRLAIERMDARGARSAWPRPMLPWQREPGRGVVDLSAWREAGR